MMKLFCRIRDKWKTTVAREKAKMKDMTFREKLGYLVANWTWEFLTVLALVGLLVGGIYMFDNATNRFILSVAVVDTTASEDEVAAICRDFKDYIGNTNRKDKVEIVANASSIGATHEEAKDEIVFDHQQTNILLIQTGTIDCFVATKKFADFLLVTETVAPVAEILSEEQMEKYGDLIEMDGNALRLESAAALEYLSVEYDQAYLLFTTAVHYPDTTRAFVDFIMSK